MKNITFVAAMLLLTAMPHTVFADELKSDIPIIYTPQSTNDVIVPFDDVFETETEDSSIPQTLDVNGTSSIPSLSSPLLDTSPTKVSSPTAVSREALVSYAKTFLGRSYVYGGDSLETGVDCSGFVMRIFEHFGISTGRDSRSQAQKARKISESDLLPGDLVFYASGDYINHVGIYIGDGKIIHAANSRYGIIISSYTHRTPYMYGRFIN